MPLSEHEQRLLEEMERSLYRNDADFVATVSARRGRPNYTAVVLGVLLGVVGIATLVLGVVFNLTLLGMLGFVIMLAGVLVAFTPSRRPGAEPSDAANHSARSAKSGSSFMDTLNERWDRRQEGRD